MTKKRTLVIYTVFMKFNLIMVISNNLKNMLPSYRTLKGALSVRNSMPGTSRSQTGNPLHVIETQEDELDTQTQI